MAESEPQAEMDLAIGLRASRSRGALDAGIIIANAPDPVFVSDLEGKILQANDAVSQLLGFRPDELIEQSLSHFISREETREFTAALREVVERGVTRNASSSTRAAPRARSSRPASTPPPCATQTAGSSGPSASCATCASWIRPGLTPRA